MKKIFLFLLTLVVFWTNNIFSIDKKNIVIGLCGITILSLNVGDIKWNLEHLGKYKTKKINTQKDLDKMDTISNNRAEENKEIIESVYKNNRSEFAKTFEEYFRQFSFEQVRDQYGDFVPDIEQVNKKIFEKWCVYEKNINYFHKELNYNVFYCVGGFALASFASLNHKYHWF